MKSKNISTKKIVMVALLAALTVVGSMLRIKVPSVVGTSAFHLGNIMCALSGILLGPWFGGLAAGLGSALADILSGYVIYGPATFLIKGMMALVAFHGFKLLHNKCNKLFSRIISGIAAEIVMIVGYFVFAGLLYGFGPAAVNIPANAVQGIAGIVIGIILFKIFEKSKTIIH